MFIIELARIRYVATSQAWANVSYWLGIMGLAVNHLKRAPASATTTSAGSANDIECAVKFLVLMKCTGVG